MESTKTLIIAFVAILIGIIVIGVIAGETVKYTKLTGQADTFAIVRIADHSINESTPHTLSKALVTGTWRTGDSTCSVSTLSVYNGSVSTANLLTAGATDCATGDYNYTVNSGVIRFCNSSVWHDSETISNTSVVGYHYCPDSYVSSSWGRMSMNLVPGFFAIGLLLFAAFLIFKVIREEGAGDIIKT